MSVGAGHLPCQAARLAAVPNLPDCDIEAFQATASLPAPFTPPPATPFKPAYCMLRTAHSLLLWDCQPGRLPPCWGVLSDDIITSIDAYCYDLSW